MSGYLLDTHALMWAINEPSRLGDGAAEVLRDRGSLLVVSAASAWELYAKYRIGRLPGAGPWLEALEGHVRRLGAEFLPVDGGLHGCRIPIPVRVICPHRVGALKGGTPATNAETCS